MPYNFNKDRYHDMDKDRTLGLIGACEMEIPIYKEDYDYIIRDEKYKNYINSKQKKLISHFPESKYRDELEKRLHISFIPDYRNNRFKLLFSPKEMIDNIFDIIGIDTKIQTEYFNPIEYYYKANVVKEVLLKYMNDLTTEMQVIASGLSSCKSQDEYDSILNDYNKLKEKYEFVKASRDNTNYIFDFCRGRDLTDYIDKKVIYDVRTGERKELVDFHIHWRNLANYIAISSLKKYEETNKSIYLQYPYKYYEKCTKPDENGKQMLYVNDLIYDNEKYDHSFNNYNKKCEKIFKESPLRIEFLLNYKDNNYFTVLETLNPGSLMLNNQQFGNFLLYKAAKTKKTNNTKDDLIAERQLLSKTNFYSNNKEFTDHLYYRIYTVEDNETGYVGFILDNDYIVLDKFFKESLDGHCVPAKDAAVYAMPLDLYEKLKKNSGLIRLHIKNNPKDDRVLHKYHTESDSYTKAIIDLTKKPSISQTSAEDFVRRNGGIIPEKKTNYTLKKKNKKDKKNKD